MRSSELNPVSIDVFSKQLNRVTLVVLLAFSVLGLRLWFLQIINGWSYRTKSESNRIHLQDILPSRGIIYDSKGEILVNNRPSYDLCVIPEEVQDLEGLLENLARWVILDLDHAREEFRRTARIKPFKSVCLKKGISRDELARVETQRFNLPGVHIAVNPRRHYIYNDFSAHLLGYLGEISEVQLRKTQYRYNKPGDLVGMSGVEKKWQPSLNGVRGGEQVEVDAEGRRIKIFSKKSATPGANLHLTIDKDLQAQAEMCLRDKRGAVVAMDPNSGKILALASSPSFDPNLFIGGIDKATWEMLSQSEDHPLQNRVISGQYPPASVFKIVVALAALEEGLIEPEDEISCGGVFFLGSGRYHCWKKYGHGKVDLHRALAESCDVYFYNLGQSLGVDKIAHYAKMFGFGEPTGLDLGHERGGLIPTREWKLRRWGKPWQAGETISTSIGQSFVLVTPIQAVCMVSAVFNGGMLYRPQVTSWVGRSEEEKVHQFVAQLKRQVKVKPEYLTLVKDALIGVVNDAHGTGKSARLKEMVVAGKTGTAQVITAEKEKDLLENGEVPFQFRDHAWFVAVAPAEEPRIALAVLVEHGGHGGSAAAPIAKKMIEIYLE